MGGGPVKKDEMMNLTFLFWTKLIGKDTRLGWDGEKKIIAASDEWWKAKIQVCIIQPK